MINKLGNITKVKWHYCNKKYAVNSWGHCRETFSTEELKIETQMEVKDDQVNIMNTYPVTKLNDIMLTDRKYAYVYIEKGKIYIRNLFDSSDSNGFDQKNTYFKDETSGEFELTDTNNLLLSYLNLGYIGEINSLEDRVDPIYYCVEYELLEGVNMNILNYCVKLENKVKELNERVTSIEQKIIKNEEQSNKSWFKYNIFNIY